MIDKQLIERISKRERNAFKELYDNSISYTYSIVRRYILNSSDHADVIQDIYARVFLKIKQYDSSKGEFKYWLRRLAINQCLERYREQKKEIKVIDIDNVQEAQINHKVSYQGMTTAEIEAQLKDLPQGYKQVFMLVEIDGYSQKEASEILGINIQTVRSQLSRGKAWLKKNEASFLNLKKIR